ncbi:putative nucleic acid-binding Zn-ribbon protein [Arcanobacterium pluranimalium]|uniref:zinc ribbon domain-containing protein n=1 Tax=Arcanobacterium pluranimalium TaxID=108028 RepID=UPI00195DF846|nr:hypothetical protein [Arcanobacterium pluranimalium]MBM7825542.1 putative nucleic acid-binding Zn-ribbon protein [Arcanobacterium pluranimalium]
MTQAPREDQLQLLEVARLDAQLAKTRSQMRNHHLRGEIATAVEELAHFNEEVERKHAELSQLNEAVDSAQEQLTELEAKLKLKDKRLNAGIGMDSRELLTLQSEIETGREQVSQLEDSQFDLLESCELLEKQLAHLEKEIVQKVEHRTALEKQLEQDLAELESEHARINEQRTQLFAPLAPALQQAYERARVSGGLAVIGLHRNGESTGGVALSPIEVAAVNAHDPNDIYISEDYDCVVVLLDA